MTQRCPGCQQELTQEQYTQSTWGTRGRSCRSCVSLNHKRWTKKYPERAKELYRRWKAKQSPEYKKDWKLRKLYGITYDEFIAVLTRQRFRCLGCQRGIDTRASVDHDHKTGLVRGLLCNSCNTALGLVKDDRSTLRRLMSYLEYDMRKQYVYLIGSLRNPEVVGVGDELRKAGFEVVDDWIAAGPRADDYWKAYEKGRGRSYSEALVGRAASNVFHFDQSWLDLSDYAVLLLPAGRSAHLELGYFCSKDKPGYVLAKDERSSQRYDVMYKFTSGVFYTINDLIAALQLVQVGLPSCEYGFPSDPEARRGLV